MHNGCVVQTYAKQRLRYAPGRLTALTLLSVVGCAAPNLDDDVAAETAPLAATKADVRPIDAPSPPAILLRWKGDSEGASAVKSLDFVVENTTDRSLAVELHVVSSDGATPREMPMKRVTVAGRTALDQSVAVDQLAAQLEGASISTQVFAVYTAADGVQRSTPLDPVWVTHERSYGTAFVRGARAEAKNNGARGLSRLRDADNATGRSLDATSRQFATLATASAKASPRTQLVTSSEFPDLRGRTSGTLLASQNGSGQLQKAGIFRVCMRVPYVYFDTLWGEDFLNANTLSTPGLEAARFMTAVVIDPATGNFLVGSLDASGCTGNLSLNDGPLIVGVTTQVALASPSTVVNVTNDNTQQFQWWTQTLAISGAGRTLNVDMTGVTRPGNAAIAVSMALSRQSSALAPNNTTNIFVDQDCSPEFPNSGCQKGNEIFLGFDKTTTISWTAFKYAVLHEFGHQVQRNMYGMQPNPMTMDGALPASCNCLHVPVDLRSHCLQGRMDTTSAQIEGFGHFFAADVLNRGTDNNCVFVYYKAFQNDNGTQSGPPIGVSCLNQVRWMENHCNAAGHGTEFDWMNFYWSLHNKTTSAYSYANIQSVYLAACGGGACNTATPWNNLQAGANTAFGATSAKASYWNQTGINFGVKH